MGLLIGCDTGIINICLTHRLGHAVHHIGIDGILGTRQIQALGHALQRNRHHLGCGGTQQLGVDHILHQFVDKDRIGQDGIQRSFVLLVHQGLYQASLHCRLYHSQQGVEFSAQAGLLPLCFDHRNRF